MDSLTFLDRAGKSKPQPVYALPGDEPFLKRQVVLALRRLLLGEEESEFGFSSHAGDGAVWASIHDELQTLPFLGGRRLVLIDAADPFVTEYRSALEKYLAAPAATGVLILDVDKWPSNTRLAKLIDSNGTIVCNALKPGQLPQWCARWCQAQHGKQLVPAAAQLLVELVGAEMGLLDQELAKLAVYVGDTPTIQTDDVDRLVGNSRAGDVWKIFDQISAGQPGQALALLDRLFDQGNPPEAILGAMSYQVRLLARAGRLKAQRRPLADLGMPPWKVSGVEAQMRHLGPGRLARLYDWLLEVDQGIKGGSQLPKELLLQRLVVRLARKV